MRRQLEASLNYAAAHDLQLDESLRDLGVSAFRGKNSAVGALSQFLRLTEAGRIPRGSYLLVESLDRLSREPPRKAFTLFNQIIEAGVRVVTLTDNQVFDAKRLDEEPWALMGSIMVMMRAHEESRMKSERISAAWRNKQANASAKKLTKRCPAWLRLSPDRSHFDVVPEIANAVRKIYEWTAAGSGRRAIVRMLNRAGAPPLGSREEALPRGNGTRPRSCASFATTPFSAFTRIGAGYRDEARRRLAASREHDTASHRGRIDDRGASGEGESDAGEGVWLVAMLLGGAAENEPS